VALQIGAAVAVAAKREPPLVLLPPGCPRAAMLQHHAALCTDFTRLLPETLQKSPPPLDNEGPLLPLLDHLGAFSSPG